MPCSGETIRNHRLSTVGGFGAILLWSTTVAVARSLSELLGPVTAAAAVYGVAGAAALVSLAKCRNRRREILRLPRGYLVGCGALFVGYTVLLFLAIGWAGSRQQTLEVGLLNYLWPALTVLFSWVLLGRKANWLLLPGTLLALVGVFLVVTQGASVSLSSLLRNFQSNPASYSMALAAAVSWALYSILTRKWAGGRSEGAVVLFLPITAMVLLLTCCFIDEPREWSRGSVVEALFLGGATYMAYSLWDHAMRRGNVAMVAAASYLTPLFSTIVCCLYLVIMPGARLWVGCAFLVLGSILSWRSVSGGVSCSSRGISGNIP